MERRSGFRPHHPGCCGREVFVHISSFSNRLQRPIGNEIVTYELTSDDTGRARAEKVAFMHDIPADSGRSLIPILALPVLFILFVATTVVVDRLPAVILGLYVLASAATFAVYAQDKSAARNGGWRTDENMSAVRRLLCAVE